MGSTFRLAGLLRFRQAQEEQAAASLAQANARRKEQREHVSKVRGTLAAAPSNAGSAAALRATAAARSSSRSMLLELAALTHSVEEAASNAEKDLLTAKKSAASLEKLADRHEMDRQELLLHDEQLFLDELAVSRATSQDDAGTATSLRVNR
ncbi:flagellar FliJ family protein [Arthrobacter antibioticus]|uniref:flagellar FliJ family protein n=1 Tax=Arthrobacter sp. H35-MC1 TaxID=3046203 RepID=UPI0024B93961|nr:flagellar FliJ family protein [Arthrobacter sp. H35-MC1]MDJ0316649.1 flagellar FliJ family protein [Arthrobacter sp. H35-MC1]